MTRSGRLIAQLAVSMAIVGAVVIPVSSSAQSTLGFGGLAGLSLPMDSKDMPDYSTGWHVGGLVDWKYPGSSVAFRAELAYEDLGSSETQHVLASPSQPAYDYHYKQSMISGIANILWSPPTGSTSSLKPYLKGGLGVYRRTSSFEPTPCFSNCSNNSSVSSTKPGGNIGAGISVPVAGLNTGLEASWHMLLDKDEEGGAVRESHRTQILRVSALFHF